MDGKVPQGIYLQLVEVPRLLTTPCLCLETLHRTGYSQAKALMSFLQVENVYVKPNLLPFLESILSGDKRV